MAIKQGNSDVSAIYVGSTEVTKIYRGTSLVWESGPAPFQPYTINSWDIQTYMPLGATTPETEPILVLFK